MSIGERSQKMRTAAGLNQNLIAQYLNVNQSLVSKIESGEREVSTDIIRKLADLFDCQVNTFLEDDFAPNGLNVTFEINDLSCDDLESIATINRIALNLEEMESVLGLTL